MELDWLRSYLLDRRQSVFYDGVSSSVRRLACGVPQGSVLGPLLFLLYTADVGELAANLVISFLRRRLATLYVGPPFI